MRTRPEPNEVMFSGPLGEITNELDPYTEADRVGVHATLLAAFSAFIGTATRVETGKGRSPLAFWPVLIGRTGVGRKGTATNHAMRVVNEALAEWSDQNVIAGTPATGLGLISELSERSDGIDAQPVMIIEEEMDALIENAKRDKKIGVMIRKGWDAASLIHKTKVDHIQVRKPHLALVGHCQPKNWAQVARGRDNTGGTWNRMVPLYVERSKTLPVFGKTGSEELVIELGERFREMATWATQVRTVTVPDKIAEIFEAKHRPACEALTEGNDQLGQMAERSLAYVVRIAALYALADRRSKIAVRDFDAALAIVTYSIDTILVTVPAVQGQREINAVALEEVMEIPGPQLPADEHDIEKLRAFLAEYEDGANAKTIYNSLSMNEERLKEAAGHLDKAGEIEWVKKPAGPRGGRRAEVYRLIAPEDRDEGKAQEERPNKKTPGSRGHGGRDGSSEPEGSATKGRAPKSANPSPGRGITPPKPGLFKF